MANIKTVGIKDLKNNLRAHLRAVRRRVRILVSDRNAVVAELHEPTSPVKLADGTARRLLDQTRDESRA